MNIDILFLDNELTDYEQFFDKNQFEEYCETHSFTCLLYTSDAADED